LLMPIILCPYSSYWLRRGVHGASGIEVSRKIARASNEMDQGHEERAGTLKLQPSSSSRSEALAR
jgi:hypothetical protein